MHIKFRVRSCLVETKVREKASRVDGATANYRFMPESECNSLIVSVPERNMAFSIHGGEVDIFSGHHQLDTLEGHKRHQRISIHGTPLSLKSQHANGKATTPHSAFLLSLRF